MITDLQRIHIKILSNAQATLNLEPFIEIFGRWRMEKNHPAEWVDLADYAHVPRGPGIMLVGQRANFAFDMADPAPGILYAAKKGLTGSHLERVSAAMKACLELAKRLIAEPEFPAGVALRPDALELRFADRLVTPNTPATDQELGPVVQQAMDRLFGVNGYQLAPQSDSQEAYGFSVRAKRAEPLDELSKRIGVGSRD